MSHYPLPYAWHDGRLLPLDEVRISPLDRGYLFGDGVYEVIPVYDGKPVGLREHLTRLQASLAAIDLPAEHGDDQLIDLFEQVIDANGGGNQTLYLQLSRSGDTRRNHAYPTSQTASLFIMSQPLVAPTVEDYSDGKHAILLEDTRWQRCDIKSISLLANVMAKQAAEQHGAVEAILYRDGWITEASSSAVAIVVDGVLKAPPLTPILLPSVTRTLTWQLAAQSGVPVLDAPISTEECLAADEVLILSSTKEIVPVVSIDAHTIADGRPGDIWRTLFDAYQDRKLA